MARRVVAPLGADRDGDRCDRWLGPGARTGCRQPPDAVNVRVEFHPLAVDEIASAVDWYERQRSGLGMRFLDVVETTVNRASGSPRIGTPVVADQRERVAASDVPGRIPVDVGVRGRRRVDRRSCGVSPTATSQLLVGTFRVAEWPEDRIHPRFHPRNAAEHLGSGRYPTDTEAAKDLLSGIIWYSTDTRAATHDPSVVGSSPTRPTTNSQVKFDFRRVRTRREFRISNIHPVFLRTAHHGLPMGKARSTPGMRKRSPGVWELVVPAWQRQVARLCYRCSLLLKWF